MAMLFVILQIIWFAIKCICAILSIIFIYAVVDSFLENDKKIAELEKKVDKLEKFISTWGVR